MKDLLKISFDFQKKFILIHGNSTKWNWRMCLQNLEKFWKNLFENWEFRAEKKQSHSVQNLNWSLPSETRVVFTKNLKKCQATFLSRTKIQIIPKCFRKTPEKWKKFLPDKVSWAGLWRTLFQIFLSVLKSSDMISSVSVLSSSILTLRTFWTSSNNCVKLKKKKNSSNR